jgi:hypothetical protein
VGHRTLGTPLELTGDAGTLGGMSTSTLARVQTRFPSAVAVAVGLAAGFGIAQGTGVRALGGVVFAAGGLAAGWLWYRRRGLAVAAALGVAYIAAFVLAHVLALGVGWPAWLAVGVVTAAAAALSWAIADRPAS